MLRGSLWSLGAVTALFLSGFAWADDSAISGAQLGAPLTAEVLDQQRAGAELHLNLMDVKAHLDDNQAINTLNGSNYIAGGALSNSSGLPVAVQNSGNNVIIQNSFILNMNVK
jgi:hypothetical protein